MYIFYQKYVDEFHFIQFSCKNCNSSKIFSLKLYNAPKKNVLSLECTPSQKQENLQILKSLSKVYTHKDIGVET